MKKTIILVALLFAGSFMASAQKYGNLIDKTIATVGGEFITLSELESEVRMNQAGAAGSDKLFRCEVLESMLKAKLFLMQARIDSLNVNPDMVEANLNNRIDQIRFSLGGDEAVEKYFGKSLTTLRGEWRNQLEVMSLVQQEQQEIASKIPEVTPYDIRSYLDTVDRRTLIEVPTKYQFSQICVYPDKESAALEVKEQLLELRERVLNGERFATLARIYSQDPGSAVRGGELGMAPRSQFWPVFSDAAMSLKPGMISQIVETPDGFHIIQLIEKNGDAFNARHILRQPSYTSEDRDKAFARLDSLKTLIDSSKVSFETLARMYSEDPASRTNGGQVADPNTGSSYFDVDQLKGQDYAAIRKLKIGEVSGPIESLDNEGRNGQTVYKIIRLDKIVPSHVATFENDYDDIYRIVENVKQSDAIDNFVVNKIKETHIIIDPIFKDCDFSLKEWETKFRD